LDEQQTLILCCEHGSGFPAQLQPSQQPRR
jgi:hypothetical protein